MVNMYDLVSYRGGVTEPTRGESDGHAYKPETYCKIINKWGHP